MSTNHLIIGLGGTGGRIIRSFRNILYRDCGSMEPTGVNLQYLYVDSSDEMMSANDPSWKVLDKSVQLDAGDQIHLTSGDLTGRLENLHSYPQLSGWIGDVSLWKDILNLGSGEAKVLGGQKRILGRFLFSCHVEEFLTRLNTKMSVLRTSADSAKSAVTVHIFSGLAGGTGSGCLIDIIAQIRSKYPSADCKIHVYVLLPERFPKVGWKKANYHANGFAALTELNALSVGQYRPYDLAGHGERLKGLSGPFQACYVITNENDGGMQFDVEKEIPDTIAMFLYQKVVAGADGKWPDLERVEEWENKSLEAEDGQRSRLFLSFGLKQITYPEEEIKDYLSYSLSQQACLQMLYNNWAQSFVAEVGAFSPEGFVLQPQIIGKWCLTREHLFLEKRFSLDDMDVEQESWRPMTESWKLFVKQISEDVKETESGNAAALLRKRCRDRFETAFAGGEGVKGFYQRRSKRVDDYAKTILRGIEDDLLKEIFGGKQSFMACDSILAALSAQLSRWLADWKGFCDKATKEAAKAKSRLDSNVEEFESMGPLARMFGLRNRILEAANDNAFQYFSSASIAEGWTFAEAFARALDQQIFVARDALKKVIGTLHGAVVVCEDKCVQLKPKDSETNLRGVWVRLYDSKEVEDYLSNLVQDEDFQMVQASRAREAVQKQLMNERLQLSRAAAIGVDALLDCLTRVAVSALREVNDAVSQNGGGADKKLRRLLSVSIVDKLNERYHGNQELMRKEIEIIIKTARDFVQFSGAERSRAGLGVNREGILEEAFAIAMPDAEQNGGLIKQFQQASERPIRWVDTKQRRRHEITLLKFTQLFPLRLLSAVEFLRDEYSKALTTSNNPKRTKLELHTEGDRSQYPSLFVPDPVQKILPKILLGLAAGVIVLETNDKQNFQLIYDRSKGGSERIIGRHPLGRGYRDVVGAFNVGSINFGDGDPPDSETTFVVLIRETESVLKECVTAEARSKFKKSIVALIDEIPLQLSESREELSTAATTALAGLEKRWSEGSAAKGGWK